MTTPPGSGGHGVVNDRTTEQTISRRVTDLTLPRLLPWALIIIGVVVAALTFQDYGPTPDDAVQATYGELALRYFTSAGADTACNNFINLRFYGPLVEMVPALFYDADRSGKFEARHLILGLLALLSIPAVWSYGRRFDLPGLPLFAVLAVSTLPRFYGHWFNNSKDMPFAVAMIWFMVALAWLVVDPRWQWRQMIACGLAMGIVLCVRPGGFPILLLFLAGAAALGILATRSRGSRVPGQRWLQRVPRVAIVPLVAWVVMVLPWPWAHQAPIANPLEAMQVATRFPTTMPILFDGVTWQSDELPWYYIPKYVLIGSPLGVLVLALVGLLRGFRSMARDWSSQSSLMVTLTLMWLFAPLLLFAVLRPNVYGGMRHFLFVLPALGVLAGYGAAEIWSLARPGRRLIVGLVLAIVLLLPVRDLVRLHPYQTAYYNELVGGVGGAAGRYWTDYSMSSYREAIEWVNDQAAQTPERQVRVVIAAGPAVMMWVPEYPASNVEIIPMRDLRRDQRKLGVADFYIATTRLQTDHAFPRAPIVHTIGRDGAVFTVVKRLSP